MELILIKEDSAEWLYMWNWIIEHPYTKQLTPSQALGWQYKGSLRQGSKTLHQFELGAKSLVLACSNLMAESDISKVIRLK